MDKDKELLLLIEQAKEGKQSAYTKLYEKYKSEIRLTILNIVKNEDVADDLLSVTFVKAFKKLESYVDHISFRMWLKTIAINSSIDYIRHTKNEMLNNYVDDEESNIQIEGSVTSPEYDYIIQEQYNKLLEYISCLKYKYRQLLMLRFFDGLSYKEIAEKLAMPESSVKTELYKARQKVRDLSNINNVSKN